ncbi:MULTISPECIES: hypothetical protein [unclassified Lentimonas]|uniref:hypothetical protein n=1 Tax=unclassified Lentimonas TaxID=2630993 RepID=UPI00132AC25F|nr:MULTISPECIES: hypothetical protein [unclassified Lentimonas]CAA6677092.1 Unannotated [Lentimonas sp. CC4]CAA6686286.1 Unannotated [Lentimonas sp. CC6]CAA6692367.1 Unannotated [Lentimonas sp. CC10]CAA6694704.1 Unannotated [Lentimonas sp. CC19]CAA7071449.1 Unannotated [Lentimonas sp. CC11]
MRTAWIQFIVLGCAVALFSGCQSSDVSKQDGSVAASDLELWYSQQVTKSDLWRMNMQWGRKFYEPWKYMGTKDGEHFLSIYPVSGFREIYRIAEDEYPIEDPFELTARSSKWREITVFSYLGIEQALIIEAPLLDLPDRFVPVRVHDGDVEDLFMQDVPILGE